MQHRLLTSAAEWHASDFCLLYHEFCSSNNDGYHTVPNAVDETSGTPLQLNCAISGPTEIRRGFKICFSE